MSAYQRMLATGKIAALSTSMLLLSACSVLQPVTDVFVDEEEIAIRELPPITPTFTISRDWQRQVGQGIGEFYSRLQPVVVDDMLVAADRKGIVIAFDQAGKKRWQTRIGDGGGWLDDWFSKPPSAKLAGGLTAYNGKIWLGTEDGRVLGLDSNSGEIVFDANVAGEVLAKPAFGDGMVFVNTSAGRLFALDEQTGEEKWVHESDVPPLSLRGISQPASTNGGVFIGTATGKLQVNISDSGLVAWEATVTTPAGATELERIIDVDTAPVVVGGNIYVVSYNGSLVSVELRTGRVVWQREYASYQNLTVTGNNIYVTDINGSVFAIDRRNGVELWSQNALKQRVLTAPTVFKNAVVVADSFGVVHFLNASEGTYEARIELDNEPKKGFYSAPVVMGDALAVIDVDGELTVLRPNL